MDPIRRSVKLGRRCAIVPDDRVFPGFYTPPLSLVLPGGEADPMGAGKHGEPR
jgi:hypothetical protein